MKLVIRYVDTTDSDVFYTATEWYPSHRFYVVKFPDNSGVTIPAHRIKEVQWGEANERTTRVNSNRKA